MTKSPLATLHGAVRRFTATLDVFVSDREMILQQLRVMPEDALDDAYVCHLAERVLHPIDRDLSWAEEILLGLIVFHTDSVGQLRAEVVWQELWDACQDEVGDEVISSHRRVVQGISDFHARVAGERSGSGRKRKR